MEFDYGTAKANLFLGLDVVKEATQAVKKRKEKRINAKFESGDVTKVLEARGEVEGYILAKEQNPTMYGEVTENDDGEEGDGVPIFAGGKTLRQLQRDFEDIFAQKVEAAITKALEELTEEQTTKVGLAAKLKTFERDLGATARSREYLAIRNETLKNLAGLGSSLSSGKKLVLGNMFS